MGKEPPKRPRREAPLDMSIDLGFGPPRREVPRRPRELLEDDDPLGLKPKHKEPPIDLDIKIR